MANVKKIQPVQVFTTGGVKNATFLCLTNFHGYNFDNGGGSVFYSLIGQEQVINEAEGDLYESVVYHKDTIVLPANVVSQWGQDDLVVFQYVASVLGVILI